MATVMKEHDVYIVTSQTSMFASVGLISLFGIRILIRLDPDKIRILERAMAVRGASFFILG
jgi:hypothetical protein